MLSAFSRISRARIAIGDADEAPRETCTQPSGDKNYGEGRIIGFVVTISRAENLPEPPTKNVFGKPKKTNATDHPYFHVKVSRTGGQETVKSTVTTSVPGDGSGCTWGPEGSDGEDIFLPMDIDNTTSENDINEYGTVFVEVWRDQTEGGGKDTLIGRGDMPLSELLDNGGSYERSTGPTPVSLTLGGSSKGRLYLSATTTTDRFPPDDKEGEIYDRDTNSERHEQSDPPTHRIGPSSEDEELVAENRNDLMDGAQDGRGVTTNDSQTEGGTATKHRFSKWGMPRMPDLKGTLSASLQATRAAAWKLRQREEARNVGVESAPQKNMGAEPESQEDSLTDSILDQVGDLPVTRTGEDSQTLNRSETDEDNRQSLPGNEIQDKKRLGLAGLVGVGHGMQSLKDGLRTKLSRTIDVSNDQHDDQNDQDDQDEEEVETESSEVQDVDGIEFPSEQSISEKEFMGRKRSPSSHSNGLNNETASIVTDNKQQPVADVRAENNQLGGLTVDAERGGAVGRGGNGNGTCATDRQHKSERIAEKSSPLRTFLRSVIGERERGNRGEQESEQPSEGNEDSGPELVKNSDSDEFESSNDAPEESTPRSLAASWKVATSSFLKLSSPTFTPKLKGFGRNQPKDSTANDPSPSPTDGDPDGTTNPVLTHAPEKDPARKPSLYESDADADLDMPFEVATNLSVTYSTIFVTVFRASGLPEKFAKGSFGLTKKKVRQNVHVKVKVCDQIVETTSVQCRDQAVWGHKKRGETLEIPLALEVLPKQGTKAVRLAVEVWNQGSEVGERGNLLGLTEVSLDESLGRKAAWADLEMKGSGEGRVKFSVVSKGFSSENDQTLPAKEKEQDNRAETIKESARPKDDLVAIETHAIVDTSRDSSENGDVLLPKELGQHEHARTKSMLAEIEENEPDPNLGSPTCHTSSGDDLEEEHRKTREPGDGQRMIDVPFLNLGSVSNKLHEEAVEEDHPLQSSLDMKNVVAATEDSGTVSGRKCTGDEEPIEGVLPASKQTVKFAISVKEGDALAEALTKTTLERPNKNVTQNPYVTLSICGMKGATSAIVGGGRVCRWPGSTGESVNLLVAYADLYATGWGRKGHEGPVLTLQMWNQVSADRQADIFIGSGEVKLQDSVGRGEIWVDLNQSRHSKGRVKIEVECTDLQPCQFTDNRTSKNETKGQLVEETTKAKMQSEIEAERNGATPSPAGDGIGKKQTTLEGKTSDASSEADATGAREPRSAPCRVSLEVTRENIIRLQDRNQSSAALIKELRPSPVARREPAFPATGESIHGGEKDQIADKDAGKRKGGETASPCPYGAGIREATEMEDYLQLRQVHGKAIPLNLETTTLAVATSSRQVPAIIEQDAPVANLVQTLPVDLPDSCHTGSRSNIPRLLQAGGSPFESSPTRPKARTGSFDSAGGDNPDLHGRFAEGGKCATEGKGKSGGREGGNGPALEDVEICATRNLDHAETIALEEHLQCQDGCTIAPMTASVIRSKEVMNKINSRRDRARQIARRRREIGLRMGPTEVHRINDATAYGREEGLSLSRIESQVLGAAMTIQSTFRGRIARRRLRLQQRATMIIQATYRGYRERRVFLATTARVKRARAEERQAQERRSRIVSMKQVHLTLLEFGAIFPASR